MFYQCYNIFQLPSLRITFKSYYIGSCLILLFYLLNLTNINYHIHVNIKQNKKKKQRKANLE